MSFGFYLNACGCLYIKDIVFLDKEIPTPVVEEKGTVYDIFCETGTHDRFIIEMQVRGQDYFMKRSLYYMCRCVTGQLSKGDFYTDIRPVCGIFFLGEDIWGTDMYGDYIKDFNLVNVRNPNEKYGGFRQIFIDLSKFVKTENECCTRLDEWLFILKNLGNMEKMPFKNREEMFRYLEEYAEKSNMTPDERLIYDLKVDALHSYERSLEFAKRRAIEQGIRQGIQQGVQQGIEQGIERGIEQGIATGFERGMKSVAVKMKQTGMPMEQIVEFTGLTDRQIMELDKE